MNTRIPFALSTALLLVLPACDRSPPPPESEPYNGPVAEEIANAPEPLPPEPAAAEPATIPEPVAEAPPPPEPILPDEQMLEDAEATGMTARLNRDGGETENRPAEASEQK